MPEITLTLDRALALLEIRVRDQLAGGTLTQPLYFEGQPGIGKTEGMYGLGARLDMDVLVVTTANRDPTDFGAPYMVNVETHAPDGSVVASGEKLLKWSEPGFLPRVGCRPTIIFWDEFNRATQMIQNVVLRLIREGRLDSYAVPSNCVQVAAGNRPGKDGAGLARLSAAMGDRLIRINLVPDLDSWRRWGNVEVASGVGAGVRTRVHPLMLGYASWKPEVLTGFDASEDVSPTPRSVVYVSDLLYWEEDNGGSSGAGGGRPWDRDLFMAQCAGAVGDAHAGQIWSFIQLYRELPSLDAIILDPDSAVVPHEVSAVYAVSAALAGRANAGNFGRVLRYLERLPREYSVYAVRDATLRDPGLCTTPEFTRWAIDHSDIL